MATTAHHLAARSRDTHTSPEVVVLGERRLFRGRFFAVVRRYLRIGDAVVARELVLHPGSVAVLPVVDGADGPEVVLIRQFRAAAGGPVLEIPAGKRDEAGESPEETARRECIEEVGLRPGALHLLHVVYPSPGYTDERLWIYAATDTTAVPSAPHGVEEEGAEVVRLPLDDAVRAVERGDIVDAKTVIAVYASRRRFA